MQFFDLLFLALTTELMTYSHYKTKKLSLAIIEQVTASSHSETPISAALALMVSPVLLSLNHQLTVR